LRCWAESVNDCHEMSTIPIKQGEIPMPLIHMNGNSRERLTEYYEEAARALREEALQKFNEIDFHPRDYYPLGNEAFTQAQAERIEIYKAFQRIQDYLEKHIEHLYADV